MDCYYDLFKIAGTIHSYYKCLEERGYFWMIEDGVHLILVAQW